MEGYEVVGILGLSAHNLVDPVLWLVCVHFFVHVPPDFLSCSHWVHELLLWHLGKSAEFSLKVVQVFVISFEDFGWLLGNCEEIFGVEVKVFIKDSVMLFFLDVLSEDGVDLYLVHLTTGALCFWFRHNFI